MNRKILFRIIISLLVISLLIIVIYNKSTRYKNYIVNNTKWNKIISTRTHSDSIVINSIKFNDYSLVLDKNSNILYHVYSNKEKYNPTIDYTSNEKVKLIINKSITENDIKILIYNDKYYNEYSLVLTNKSIMNIKFNENKDDIKRVSVSTTFYDNRVGIPQKVIKSDGKITLIENSNDYYLSLKKESLGHNERDNDISILGMERHDEYILNQTNEENKNSILLFINNEYKGNYMISHRERKVNNEPKQKNR